MDRERFEDKVSKKFEGQTIETPAGIWSNIEHALNAELVSKYEAQHLVYKWVAVAAVFVVVFLLSILYFPFERISTDSKEYHSYNALLSQGWNSHTFYQPDGLSSIQGRNYSFDKISHQGSKAPTQSMLVAKADESRDEYEEIILNKKIPTLELASISYDIYWYRSAGAGLPVNKPKETFEKKVWAGVEAGAGTFSDNLSESSVLASSVNPAGIASALGTDGFVNPTTSISPNMEDGKATSIGIDFGVALGRKWTLESGLAYTSLTNSGSAAINVVDVFTIDSRELTGGEEPTAISQGPGARETVIEVQESYDHEVSLTNNIQLASIPLKAGYYVVDKKFSLRLNAGLAANYLINGSLSDPSSELFNNGDFSLYNDWSFDGIGGLELGYSLFDNFAFTIEPNYRHSITTLSNSASNPSRFVLQTGLRYRLK